MHGIWKCPVYNHVILTDHGNSFQSLRWLRSIQYLIWEWKYSLYNFIFVCWFHIQDENLNKLDLKTFPTLQFVFGSTQMLDDNLLLVPLFASSVNDKQHWNFNLIQNKWSAFVFIYGVSNAYMLWVDWFGHFSSNNKPLYLGIHLSALPKNMHFPFLLLNPLVIIC